MAPRRLVVFLVVPLLGYVTLVGWRGVVLVRDGRGPFVALGIGVLLLPVVGLWVVWQELRCGGKAQQLARELASEGGFAADELPRRPSGRVDLAAADAIFAQRRAEVEQAPNDWRAWYRLAIAYGDARDIRQGRQALRRAIHLHG